jgi:hypothetical protein
VNALIGHKANLEASDNLKMTAVMAAAASGQVNPKHRTVQLKPEI